MSKLSTPARTYLFELTVIVLGVLIALAVDEWNDGRRERVMESEYVLRLSADLRQDTTLLSLTLRMARDKASALTYVDQTLRRDPGLQIDTIAFLEALLESTVLGWQDPALMRATFDDLLSTGNLRLIHDTGLRDRISTYYRSIDNYQARVQRRRGEYPQLVYRLVPRAADVRGDEFAFDPTATTRSMTSIVESVRASAVRSLIIAEQNLASFLVLRNTEMRAAAVDLLAALEGT